MDRFEHGRSHKKGAASIEAAPLGNLIVGLALLRVRHDTDQADRYVKGRSNGALALLGLVLAIGVGVFYPNGNLHVRAASEGRSFIANSRQPFAGLRRRKDPRQRHLQPY